MLLIVERGLRLKICKMEYSLILKIECQHLKKLIIFFDLNLNIHKFKQSLLNFSNMLFIYLVELLI